MQPLLGQTVAAAQQVLRNMRKGEESHPSQKGMDSVLMLYWETRRQSSTKQVVFVPKTKLYIRNGGQTKDLHFSMSCELFQITIG